MDWIKMRRPTRNSFRPEFDHETQEASQVLDKLVNEFEGIENSVRLMSQSAKKIPDILLALNKFDIKAVEDLTNARLFDADEQMRAVLEEYHKLASVATSIGDEYIITLQKTFNNSTKQLKQSFAEMKSAIRLREAIYNDVIKYSRKAAVYSQRERTGANLVKLVDVQRDLAASQEEFSKRTLALASELSKFLNSGVDMFQPSLEAFIAAEMVWIRTCRRSMNTQASINEAINGQQELGGRDKLIEESFGKLNSLSIMSSELK